MLKQLGLLLFAGLGVLGARTEEVSAQEVSAVTQQQCCQEETVCTEPEDPFCTLPDGRIIRCKLPTCEPALVCRPCPNPDERVRDSVSPIEDVGPVVDELPDLEGGGFPPIDPLPFF